MKPRVIIWAVAAAVIVTTIISLGGFGPKGALKATLADNSTIKEGVVVTLSNDKFTKEHNLPLNINLKPGNYSLFAYANNSDVFTTSFTIKTGQTTEVAIAVGPNPNQGLGENNSDADILARTELLNLFPHVDTNFELRGEFTNIDGKIQLSKVIILPYLPVAAGKPFDASEVATAKAKAIAEARQWLKDNKIPDSVTVIIESAL